MIQLDTDGVTLFYIDAIGNKVSHSIFDGTAYNDMLTIQQAQIAAALANTQAVSQYNTALATAQTNVSAGRTMLAPAKPLQIVVSNTGETTHVPFVPALPDLVPLTPSGSPLSTAAPAAATREDNMYNMILLIFKKLYPGA